MSDLSIEFAGIQAPNPFWLASAPPTNTGGQVMRAFEAGWGGAVWKTLTDEPEINVSPRFGALSIGGKKMAGFNNIELITDRPLSENLEEIRQVKQRFPDRALIASLMVSSEREHWHRIVRRVEEAGVDGLELNFGCPHGMSEKGMGSAVGQVPEYVEQITSWVKEVAQTPVIVKLTPNVTNIRVTAEAARRGGADAVSLINTINSIIGVDLTSFDPMPSVGHLGAHGGYCGPAVKPIALEMVSEVGRIPGWTLPVSGIGGIETWKDAAEFLALGATSIQVCTAVMHYGFRIVEDLTEGLNNYLEEMGFSSVRDLIGRALPRVVDFSALDPNDKVVARINEEQCIQCNLCVTACDDGAHQCIEVEERPQGRQPKVDEAHCVGCDLCALVCPVDCIEMVPVAAKETRMVSV